MWEPDHEPADSSSSSKIGVEDVFRSVLAELLGDDEFVISLVDARLVVSRVDLCDELRRKAVEGECQCGDTVLRQGDLVYMQDPHLEHEMKTEGGCRILFLAVSGADDGRAPPLRGTIRREQEEGRQPGEVGGGAPPFGSMAIVADKGLSGRTHFLEVASAQRTSLKIVS